VPRRGALGRLRRGRRPEEQNALNAERESGADQRGHDEGPQLGERRRPREQGRTDRPRLTDFPQEFEPSAPVWSVTPPATTISFSSPAATMGPDDLGHHVEARLGRPDAAVQQDTERDHRVDDA